MTLYKLSRYSLINLFTGTQHLPHAQALGEQWQEKKLPFNKQKPRAEPDSIVDGLLLRSVGLRWREKDRLRGGNHEFRTPYCRLTRT